MKLFDDMERNDTGPASFSEAKFNYLNRSARPAFLRVRAVLEDWFSRYPGAHRRDLHSRFRSTSDIDHQSAFFEVFLHELLLRLDCRLEIHPSVGGSVKRPDFLVRPNSGRPFYLEGAVASGESRQEASAGALRNKVHDLLNRLDSPKFFISWEVISSTPTAPATRKIKAFLKQQLDLLDPEQIASRYKSGGYPALPHWRYSHDGWEIDFFPIPKSPELRGKPGVRPVGMELHGVEIVDPRTPLRDVILEKAGKYGRVKHPFVVAVNSRADHLDRTDVLEALFGREQFIYTQTRNGVVGPKAERAPDGVWTSPNGPRYTRLSAVLLFVGLLPWTVCCCQVCLYHNPWAEKKLDSELNRLSRMTPIGGRRSWVDGEPLSFILGLPPDWPGKDQSQ
jgi:hypothetical protein